MKYGRRELVRLLVSLPEPKYVNQQYAIPHVVPCQVATYKDGTEPSHSVLQYKTLHAKVYPSDEGGFLDWEIDI